MDQQPPAENSTITVKPGRFALSGCLALISFLVIVLAGIAVIAYHSPYYRHMGECEIQIKQVAAALTRYSIKNDAYPDKLEQLTPDYVPKTSLHCPADASKVTQVSYVYHKPTLDAPDNFIVLECRYHKTKRASSPSVIYCRKDESLGLAPQQ